MTPTLSSYSKVYCLVRRWKSTDQLRAYRIRLLPYSTLESRR